MPPGPPTEVEAWLDTLIPERAKEKLIYIEKVVRVPDAIPDLKEHIDLYRQAIYEVQESSSAYEAQRKRVIRLEDRLREQESLPVPFAADYDQYSNGYPPGAANGRHPAWDGLTTPYGLRMEESRYGLRETPTNISEQPGASLYPPLSDLREGLKGAFSPYPEQVRDTYRYESLHGNSAVALGPDVLPVIAQVDATRAHGLPQEYSEPPRASTPPPGNHLAPSHAAPPHVVESFRKWMDKKKAQSGPAGGSAAVAENHAAIMELIRKVGERAPVAGATTGASTAAVASQPQHLQPPSAALATPQSKVLG
jgi:hypothetical protein